MNFTERLLIASVLGYGIVSSMLSVFSQVMYNITYSTGAAIGVNRCSTVIGIRLAMEQFNNLTSTSR